MGRLLAGKSIIVTGASQGIGERIARALAAEGARLVLVARTRDKLERVAADLQAGEGEVEALACDVTNEQQRAEVPRNRHGGV